MVNAFSVCYKFLVKYFDFSGSNNKNTQSNLSEKNLSAAELAVDNQARPEQQDKELLTDDKMRELFGANYEGLMYYNFDSGKWNCERFCGYCVPYQEETEKMAKKLKKMLEETPQFKNWDVVACVTTLIRDKYFSGMAQKVNHPRFNKKGKSVVGTIVRRDKTTGKILPVPVDWSGVFKADSICGAIWFASKNFLTFSTQLSDYRAALVRIHSR